MDAVDFNAMREKISEYGVERFEKLGNIEKHELTRRFASEILGARNAHGKA